MTLTSLIQEFKKETQGKELSWREVGKLTEGRVIFPEDFNIREDSVELRNMGFGKKIDVPTYHLRVSAVPERNLDEVQPILDEIFSRAKVLKFGKGTSQIEYNVLWTPEDFQEERKLTGLFFDTVKVSSRAYTCNPTQVRIGMNGQSHEIEASTHTNQMVLTATGKYGEHLNDLVERYKPQAARLRLSRDDAERLLKGVRNGSFKYFSNNLEKFLHPKERSVINLSLGSGINIGTQEVIEITVSTPALRQFEQIIGKSLIRYDHGSGVTEFLKIYGLGMLRGERLSDLQSLAREIPQMNLGVIYEHSMLTNSEAKELLDKEIGLVVKGYEDMFFFGMNSHMVRGGLVKRLAREHFGDEILTGFEDLSVNDYVGFLRARGYLEPSAESVEREIEREINAKYRAEMGIEDRAFNDEPDYIAKEMHLLEFFKQSYSNGPRESIKNFRDGYKNKAPEIEISASSRDKDAAKLGRLKLPSESRLYGFGIREQVPGCCNELLITRTLPSSENIHFWSRTSVDSPIILALQEYACHEMGIRFN